jgi:hypothetical protein
MALFIAYSLHLDQLRKRSNIAAGSSLLMARFGRIDGI